MIADLETQAYARRQVARAIHRGELVRQPCEVCGGEPAEGHHEDYSKPLNVRWLCRLHHLRLHVEIRRGEDDPEWLFEVELADAREAERLRRRHWRQYAEGEEPAA